MSELNGVARALAVLLLAGMIALFAGLALDLAMPAPTDPWAIASEVTIPPDKQAELTRARTELEASLDRQAITQAEYDVQMASLDASETAAWDAVGVNAGVDEAYVEYEKLTVARNVQLSLAALAVAALLLSASVFMTQRGVAFAQIPLFAGGFLAAFAVAVGTAAPEPWIRLAIAGAAAAGAISAGRRIFGETGGSGD